MTFNFNFFRQVLRLPSRQPRRNQVRVRLRAKGEARLRPDQRLARKVPQLVELRSRLQVQDLFEN